jgi:hypothetical protein
VKAFGFGLKRFRFVCEQKVEDLRVFSRFVKLDQRGCLEFGLNRSFKWRIEKEVSGKCCSVELQGVSWQSALDTFKCFKESSCGSYF